MAMSHRAAHVLHAKGINPPSRRSCIVPNRSRPALKVPFMTQNLETLKHRYPGAETFRFGDTAELCSRLLALVRAGRKVATCAAVAEFQAGEAAPEIGRRDIALDWDGTPALVIETVDLIQCRFNEVTEAMALAEGEDDSLEGWRAGHRAYFERNCGFSPDMQIIWERFRLIEDLG